MARKQARTQIIVEICVLAYFLQHKSYYPQATNNYHENNGKNHAWFSIVVIFVFISYQN